MAIKAVRTGPNTYKAKDVQVGQNDYMAQQKGKKGLTWNEPVADPVTIPLKRGQVNLGALGQRPQSPVSQEDNTVAPENVSRPMGKNGKRYQLSKS